MTDLARRYGNPGDGPEDDPVDESERDLFLDAVADAKPLDRRGQPRPAPPPRRSVPVSGGRKEAFTVDRDGDHVEGRAHGVSRRQLTRLRRGEQRPEARLDLHRHDRDAARQSLERFVASAVAAGHRCVLVIHGRGRHSDGAPVVKDTVIATLGRGATGRRVRGFCSALPRDGGTGAMYVLLKS